MAEEASCRLERDPRGGENLIVNQHVFRSEKKERRKRYWKCNEVFPSYLLDESQRTSARSIHGNRDVLGEEEDLSLTSLLNRHEAKLVMLQTIILWDSPLLSAGALGGVIGGLWFLSGFRPLGAFFQMVLILYLYRVIMNVVWPTLRIPLTAQEIAERMEEDWTPVERGYTKGGEMLEAFQDEGDLAHFLELLPEPSNKVPNSLLELGWSEEESVQKEIGEFLWKTSQEDLRILEKAALPEVSDNEDEDEKVEGNGDHLSPTLPVPSSSAYVHECIEEALADLDNRRDEEESSSSSDFGDFVPIEGSMPDVDEVLAPSPKRHP
ncbi:unnamed protein product [Darwinula stevensoni]|uniref:FLYWCH-type domain-containing protein n=1 Tax=Darwinula stevensoni TaxID=69355 RepID=A0A7R8XAI3_9CRUS|nr:unnamed protein product [Darwinula stevensoni]CAG0891912.1 unnamed protein product [Darwinula stevensoni]